MRTSILQILELQATLPKGAAEVFSELHAQGLIPDQQQYYRELIPLQMPKEGEQFSFEVDLDRCTGCKSCVAACHSMNGLEPEETWRDTGLLLANNSAPGFQQTITTACHHCADPACLSGCPVVAYTKEHDTGIVRHLDDQCIGCQYCTWKCPYEVPKYSPSLGIVRKCDMCVDRLRAGEAPACVQACPTQAIRIKIISHQEIQERAGKGIFLPAAPNPNYTQPSTQYVSQRPLPIDLRPGDWGAEDFKHSHTPLLAMLLLTQCALGLSCFAMTAPTQHKPILALIAFLLVQVGLGVGAFHLGRPLYMFRSFLGWRTSWMSREVISFVAFVSCLGTWCSSLWIPHFISNQLNIKYSFYYLPYIEYYSMLATLTTGIAALVSSAMIYHDTHKPCWHLRTTLPRFILSSAWGGGLLAGATMEALHDQTNAQQAWLFAFGAGCSKLAFLLWETTWKNSLSSENVLVRSLALEWKSKISPPLRWGIALLALISFSPLAPAQSEGHAIAMLIGFASYIAAEYWERKHFFTTEVSIHMPRALP